MRISEINISLKQVNRFICYELSYLLDNFMATEIWALKILQNGFLINANVDLDLIMSSNDQLLACIYTLETEYY